MEEASEADRTGEKSGDAAGKSDLDQLGVVRPRLTVVVRGLEAVRLGTIAVTGVKTTRASVPLAVVVRNGCELGGSGAALQILRHRQSGRVGGDLDAAPVDHQHRAVGDERDHGEEERHREAENDQRLTALATSSIPDFAHPS